VCCILWIMWLSATLKLCLLSQVTDGLTWQLEQLSYLGLHCGADIGCLLVAGGLTWQLEQRSCLGLHCGADMMFVDAWWLVGWCTA
jgi:hypothetical protein